MRIVEILPEIDLVELDGTPIKNEQGELVCLKHTRLHTHTRDGLAEQSFTRATGGALGVDTVVIGGLIQGGTITASGRWRWRHIMGNTGNLSAGNVTNLLSWINTNTQGFSQKKGVVGNLYTKTHVLLGGPQQSNGQGQGTPVIGLCDWYQGESETLNATLAANWGSLTRAQTARTVINNFITAQGYTLGSNFKHVITILPPTNWTSATPTNWATERA